MQMGPSSNALGNADTQCEHMIETIFKQSVKLIERIFIYFETILLSSIISLFPDFRDFWQKETINHLRHCGTMWWIKKYSRIIYLSLFLKAKCLWKNVAFVDWMVGSQTFSESAADKNNVMQS